MVRPYVCGTPDALAAEAARWRKSALSWLWSGKVLPGVSAEATYQSYQEAFDAWTAHVLLTATRAVGFTPPDVIAVCRAIDGPRGVLAQSELADGTDSQKHQWYDDAEAWTEASFRLAVMSHELGHVLGLGHSGDPGDLMAPYLRPGGPTAPTAGDVAALLRLGYPPRTQPPPEPPQPPAPPPTGQVLVSVLDGNVLVTGKRYRFVEVP